LTRKRRLSWTRADNDAEISFLKLCHWNELREARRSFESTLANVRAEKDAEVSKLQRLHKQEVEDLKLSNSLANKGTYNDYMRQRYKPIAQYDAMISQHRWKEF
jgi:hypothetical protein